MSKGQIDEPSSEEEAQETPPKRHDSSIKRWDPHSHLSSSFDESLNPPPYSPE